MLQFLEIIFFFHRNIAKKKTKKKDMGYLSKNLFNGLVF